MSTRRRLSVTLYVYWLYCFFFPLISGLPICNSPAASIEALPERELTRQNKVPLQKPVPVPLYPPRIPQAPSWEWTMVTEAWNVCYGTSETARGTRCVCRQCHRGPSLVLMQAVRVSRVTTNRRVSRSFGSIHVLYIADTFICYCGCFPEIRHDRYVNVARVPRFLSAFCCIF